MPIPTIEEIILKLGPVDNRRYWWSQIRLMIASGQYATVLGRCLDHRLDDDFKEQVAIIAQAIVAARLARA